MLMKKVSAVLILPGILLAFLLAAALVFPAGAAAQENLTLPEARIDLWPEYDRPEMLVIQNFVLPASVSLPAEVVFRIPAASGGPSAVAVRQPDGALYETPYTEEQAGAWIAVQVTATTPEIVIEYYDPGLTKEGSMRSYTYQWPGDPAVESMTLRIQQPAQASQMTITGGLGTGTVGSDGLTYYVKDLGEIAAGQAFSLELQYTKPSDDLTVSGLPVQPASPIQETTAGSVQLVSALPWVLGGFGVLFIAVGGWWYWRSGRGDAKQTTPARARGSRSSGKLKGKPAPSDGEYIYCHQCGNRAAPGDRFCRTCGTQLRGR